MQQPDPGPWIRSRGRIRVTRVRGTWAWLRPLSPRHFEQLWASAVTEKTRFTLRTRETRLRQGGGEGKKGCSINVHSKQSSQNHSCAPISGHVLNQVFEPMFFKNKSADKVNINLLIPRTYLLRGKYLWIFSVWTLTASSQNRPLLKRNVSQHLCFFVNVPKVIICWPSFSFQLQNEEYLSSVYIKIQWNLVWQQSLSAASVKSMINMQRSKCCVVDYLVMECWRQFWAWLVKTFSSKEGCLQTPAKMKKNSATACYHLPLPASVCCSELTSAVWISLQVVLVKTVTDGIGTDIFWFFQSNLN